MVEGARIDAPEGIVRQVEPVEVGRVVEELRVQMADTAGIDVEVEQRPAIEEVAADLRQRVVLELEGDEPRAVPAALEEIVCFRICMN